MNMHTKPQPSFPTIPWRHVRPRGTHQRAFSTVGVLDLG